VHARPKCGQDHPGPRSRSRFSHDGSDNPQRGHHAEQVFQPALHGFLDIVREMHGSTPIAISTPVNFSGSESLPSPTVYGGDGESHSVERPVPLMQGTMSIGRKWDLLSAVVTDLRSNGDANLILVGNLEQFGPDGLRPTDAGHSCIADRLYWQVDERLAMASRLPDSRRTGAAP
jgi:hypothetical protein